MAWTMSKERNRLGLNVIGQRVTDQQSVARGVDLLDVVKNNGPIAFNPIVARKGRNEAGNDVCLAMRKERKTA